MSMYPQTNSPEAEAYNHDLEGGIPANEVMGGAVCYISILRGGCLTLVDPARGQIKIRPYEELPAQQWIIECSEGGYGFRNQSSGRLLGVDTQGIVVAGTRDIRDWERFFVRSVTGGLRLSVHWYNREKRHLFRPSLQDHLEVSRLSTAVEINYVDT